jgi:hypothetical protein
MPIRLAKINGGNVLAIHLSGRLTRADYAPLVTEFEQFVRQYGQLRVLFDMTGFRGWADGELWQDIAFDMAQFATVERVAAIGDREWQHGAAMLFESLSPATVRHFEHGESAEAQRWLVEA